MTSKSFSVRIFLQDGHSGGVKVVAKSKWSGRALVIPRSSLPDEINRTELNVPGVYILVGRRAERNLPTIYIGTGDPVCHDLAQHDSHKSFWSRVVVFASKDSCLSQVHLKYFKSCLTQLAQVTKRASLENPGDLKLPKLSATESKEAESFLAHILSICPLLDLNFFEPEVSCDSKNRSD